MRRSTPTGMKMLVLLEPMHIGIGVAISIPELEASIPIPTPNSAGF